MNLDGAIDRSYELIESVTKEHSRTHEVVRYSHPRHVPQGQGRYRQARSDSEEDVMAGLVKACYL